MSRRSVTKGKEFERAMCHALAEVIPGLQRSSYAQARGGWSCADIDSPCSQWRLECKHGKRTNPATAYEQALEDARDANDPRPVLAITRTDRRPVLVTMTLEEFIRLAHLARQLSLPL